MQVLVLVKLLSLLQREDSLSRDENQIDSSDLSSGNL